MSWTNEARLKWKREHPESFTKEAQRKYYAKHRLKILAYRKKWDKKNKKKLKIAAAKTYQKYKVKNHKRNIINNRLYYKEFKERIFKKLGDKCIKCGFKDKRALQIDHKSGGGRKELKTFKNFYKYFDKVLSDTENRYQILCANCNSIKRYENNELRRINI